MTVSGRTTARASRAFGNNLQIQPNTNLSAAMNVSRVGLPRRGTLICCRSTRASASSAARDRNRSTTRPNINLMRSSIRLSVARFSATCQPDSIYDRTPVQPTGSINSHPILGGLHHLYLRVTHTRGEGAPYARLVGESIGRGPRRAGRQSRSATWRLSKTILRGTVTLIGNLQTQRP